MRSLLILLTLLLPVALNANTESADSEVAQETSSDDDHKDHKVIDAEYKRFLKTNKCEKKDWPRYKLSDFFQAAATEGKITPYDAVWGG